MYICQQVHVLINNVIMKGRGNRPDEALATLRFKKVLNSTNYNWTDNTKLPQVFQLFYNNK